MIDVTRLEESMKGLFPGTLGVRFVDVAPDRVRATLDVEERLCTVPSVLHGGAIMALADTLGGVATAVNLADGAATTTIESKTNFFAPGRTGTTIHAEAIPLHRGRRTMVWQTRVTSADGKLLAVVTQTQAVLETPKPPAEVMGSLFAGKSPKEQKQLLATLERAGAGLYRALAAAESDSNVARELERAAAREEENAVALERMLGG